MPQCQAITKAGEQCKKDALEGIVLCALHRPKEEPAPAPPEPTAKADLPTRPMEAKPVATFINKDKPVKVIYKGRGTYWVAGRQFSTQHRVQEVPFSLVEYLTEEEPELFDVMEG